MYTSVPGKIPDRLSKETKEKQQQAGFWSNSSRTDRNATLCIIRRPWSTSVSLTSLKFDLVYN